MYKLFIPNVSLKLNVFVVFLIFLLALILVRNNELNG